MMMMMNRQPPPRAGLLLCILCLILLHHCPGCDALFADDVGELDFLLSTGGHGPPSFVAVSTNSNTDTDNNADNNADTMVLTANPKMSCSVAARSIATGKLLWRRNVCAKNNDNDNPSIALSQAGNVLVSLDAAAGIWKSWNVATGSLWFDQKITAGGDANVWAFPDGDTADTYIAVQTKGGGKSVYTKDGTPVSDISPGNPPATPDLAATTTAHCPALELVAGFQETSVIWRADANGQAKEKVLSSSSSSLDKPITPLSSEDSYASATLLECSQKRMIALYTTQRGTLQAVEISVDNDDDNNNNNNAVETTMKVLWHLEEGLGHVSSALLLDASHAAAVDLDATEQEQLLTVPSRLAAQGNGLLAKLSSIGNVVVDTTTTAASRNNAFGFVKVAVMLLAAPAHRIVGINTSGPNRGGVRYAVDLPDAADWHRLVHGGAGNSRSLSRDVLVLSSLSNSKNKQLQYRCLEGTHGEISDAGSIDLTSPVSQVIPIALSSASASSCHQGAVLILQDQSSVVVPATAASEFADLVAESKNGFFFHSFNSDGGDAAMRSFVFDNTDNNSNDKIREVGMTSFAGETILDIAYPPRDEAFQSPCHALGDNSLLLKYRNPHIVAVVSSSSTDSDGNNELGDRLQRTKRPPKPVGASAGSEEKAEETPNLFVTILDTVSGQIIHRTSHTHAASSPAPSIVISENWVFYTFMNAKTRRSEIGVLTLFEGQIHEKGLTAFSAPDRSTSFSSLDGSEAKPVVLAKTYSSVKALTALGVTSSRGGVGNRRVIMATTDGQIFNVDRKMLETRRPMGETNQFEKKEGLQQYNELIPSVSFTSLSYTQLVQSATKILSSSTDLESQSLVMAFGGPDVFFTRTSPSRGFDLLPESFNKPLLSIVGTGLLVALFVVKGMADKKSKKMGWG